MFSRGIQLPFRLLGIPLILDWTFLLVLPLMAYLIGANAVGLADQLGFENAEALGEGWVRYVVGLVAAVGLFACVVLHELGHAIAARFYGVEVERITLWFLGGVAQMPEIPRKRGAEAIVGIAGPIVSVGLAGAFAAVLPFAPTGMTSVRFVIAYLAIVNLALAIFNLLPALPLDGGRVLRSLLALAMPHAKATMIAGTISRVIAVGLGLFGLFTLNVFLILIAFFIYIAVSSETQMGRMEAALRGVPAREIMNPEVKTVPPDLPVPRLLERMLHDRHLGFPVVEEGGRLVGVVTLDHAQEAGPHDRVGDVMNEDVATIGEFADGTEVARLMGRDGFGRVVVLDDRERVAGIITKRDLMRVILVREAGLGPGERRAGAAEGRERWRVSSGEAA